MCRVPSFFLYLRTFSLFRFAFVRLFDVVCRVSCNTFERRADAGVDKRINSMCNVKVRHRPLLFLLANSRKLPFLESKLTQQFAQKRVFHLSFSLSLRFPFLSTQTLIISSFVQYYRSRSRSRSLSACLACLLLLRVLLVKCARTDASAAFSSNRGNDTAQRFPTPLVISALCSRFDGFVRRCFAGFSHESYLFFFCPQKMIFIVICVLISVVILIAIIIGSVPS